MVYNNNIMNKNIKLLNKELINKLLIGTESDNNITPNQGENTPSLNNEQQTNNFNNTGGAAQGPVGPSGIINKYNKINNIKQNSINKINKSRLSKTYNEYNYNNRIYKWNNNLLINNINLDKIVKTFIKYLFNSKINTTVAGRNTTRKTNNTNPHQGGDNKLTTIFSSEPLFLHTNDKLNIYIRILIPSKTNMKNNYNKIISKHFINTINKFMEPNTNNNINIITILNKLYNKKVNIIPIFINNKAGGMNEFIIGNKSIYSPYKYNITINKLNKYIIPKSTITKNHYINKNSLYNIIYYNYIYNIFNINNSNKNIGDILHLNSNITILPNMNNRYITGYNLHYAGKLPKADSSARTIKRNNNIGSIHSVNTSAGSINTISKTFYSYNNNGLASTKATITHAPTA